jgi:hypothetical protein
VLRNPTAYEVAVEEPATPSRWQVLLLGLVIALLFYLALLLTASPFQPTLDRGIGEPAVWQTFSWGGTHLGQPHYALTLYRDRSLELTWGSVEAAAVGGANASAWVNSRTGSLCLNCD